MNANLPCPSRNQLERLLLGDMSLEEMEALQGHVAECPVCLTAIREVTTEDDLVLAVRTSGKADNIAPGDTDPTLLARLRRLHPAAKSTTSLAPDTLALTPDRSVELSSLLSPPEEPDELGRFGPYGILRSLGSGGMGIVFAARQAQPRRIVALKMILAAARDGKQRLARFRSETEIIVQLQHPNIVPVFEVGEHQGRPYYTMEYLDGGSLAQRLVIAPLAPRPAAELALVLARAVHFAHERGVVHRDLKPANVLLAADGTPKIADFGLAKQLNPVSAEPSAYQTESGAVLGTPGYMAPEQIDSKNDIGPAADVYALGAILYECLTGRPPFRAATVLETLEQVRGQEPAPISRLQPKVPRDLQTICQKCLHKEPERRYGSASALAEDLERFLGGKPIQARPVSARERVWKWARRNPALAALLTVTALSLLTLVVSSMVYNGRLRVAVERAEDKEAETRRQYRQAHDILDRMLGRLDSQRLDDVPQLKELQRSLLEDALAFYQAILQQADSPDPMVRRDAAVACKRAADIQQTLGQSDSAAENYRRAIELTESLPAEDRETPDIRILQAGSYMNWATMMNSATIVRGSGRSMEAEPYNRAAVELYERLVQQRPGDPALQNELGKAEHNRGLLFINENPQEAEAHYRKAVALRLALVRDYPEEESYQAALAEDYVDLGLLHRQTGRREEAFSFHSKADSLLRPLVDRHPAHRNYALSLVSLYVNWSYMLANAGRSQEALERLDFAVRIAEDAHRREPRDGTARWSASQAHGARAEIREFVGRFADSVKDWDRVIELNDEPSRSRWRGTRARVLTRAGDHARAVAEAGELAALPKASDDGLYFLARVHALAMRAVLSDMRLSASERDRLADRYAAEAIAILGRLKANGYFQSAERIERLQTDPDFGPLHERAEFQKLLPKK